MLLFVTENSKKMLPSRLEFLCAAQIDQSDVVENKYLSIPQPKKSESRAHVSLYKPRGFAIYE